MKLHSLLCVPILLTSSFGARAQTIVESHAGNQDDRFGTSVACAGDVDGDGIPDTIVGAPFARYATIYAGSNGAEIRTLESGVIQFGVVVRGVGDLDEDHFDDVAVAAPTGLPGGIVFLYSGKTGAMLRTIQVPGTSESLGSALCRAGDIDDDGHEEIAIGAPAMEAKDKGKSAVFYYSFAKDAIVRVLAPPEAEDLTFGFAIANAGDVDDDGFQDLVAGNPNSSSAWIYSGRTGSVLRAFSGAPQFGASVIGLGPIGSSGHEWIAIGSPKDNSGGTVTVFDAVTGATVHVLAGELKSKFGTALDCADDPNVAVGFHSLIVGAPGLVGSVSVFDMPTGALLTKVSSPNPGDAFGHSVAGLGSRDGDAYGEIAVGAPIDDDYAGAAFVFKGPVGCGPIVEHGVGCPGFLGVVPQLHMSGCALAHEQSTLTMTLEHGPAVATTALLFIGAGNGSMQLPGGCTFAFASIVGAPIVLPLSPMAGPLWPIPSSGIVVSASIPAVGFGFTLPLQAAVLDPTAQNGFSTTNAVFLTFLP